MIGTRGEIPPQSLLHPSWTALTKSKRPYKPPIFKRISRIRLLVMKSRIRHPLGQREHAMSRLASRLEGHSAHESQS